MRGTLMLELGRWRGVGQLPAGPMRGFALGWLRVMVLPEGFENWAGATERALVAAEDALVRRRLGHSTGPTGLLLPVLLLVGSAALAGASAFAASGPTTRAGAAEWVGPVAGAGAGAGAGGGPVAGAAAVSVHLAVHARPPTGDAALDRAVAICNREQAVGSGGVLTWAEPWRAACERVDVAWSEAQRVRTETDFGWLRGFVAGLPGVAR